MIDISAFEHSGRTVELRHDTGDRTAVENATLDGAPMWIATVDGVDYVTGIRVRLGDKADVRARVRLWIDRGMPLNIA